MRKKLTIFISLALAFGIVSAAWLYTNKDSNSVYSASEKKPYLAIESKGHSRETLEEWEQKILDRKTSPPIERINYTETLSRSVLSEYFRLKDANAAINEDQIAKNIAQSIDFKNQPIEYKEYSVSDLKLASSQNTEALKTYGNKLGEASLKNVYDQKNGGEFEILSKAIQLDREKELASLEPIIKNYENLIKDLLKIETPSAIADIHLNIINSLSQIKTSVSEFNSFLNDPFRGIFVLASYSRYGADLQDHMKELDAHLTGKGVNFEENESGFIIKKAAEASVKQ